MNRDELKQRLIEWLIAGDISAQEQIITNYTEAISYVADFLIRKGVTIRERGEWKDNTYCSRCGYFAEDDEGHILMSFDEFCPFCGADMRGGKDE